MHRYTLARTFSHVWRRLACGVMLVGSLGPTASSPAAGGLAGTVLVSRPTGVVLVQPLSGDSSVLPLASGAATARGLAWSTERQQIAVSVQMRQAGERAGGADIQVFDSGGAEVATLARDGPDVALLSPAWLPTGEVVYERADRSTSREPSRIEASQPDGSGRRPLVSGAQLPGPSADGAQLAYVAPGAQFDRLLVQDVATGEVRTLLDNIRERFVYFSRPRFSPDGQLVAFGAAGGAMAQPSPGLAPFAFTVLVSTVAALRRHGPGWDVWTIGADGTGLRQVTQFEYQDDLAVAWSPDGQWLAALSRTALYLVPAGTSGPATPIGPGGWGEPDWASTELVLSARRP